MRWLTLCLPLLSLLVGVDPAPSEAPIGPEPVELTTADGVTIHGWYMAAGDHYSEHRAEHSAEHYSRIPALVLLHMYRSDKRAWSSMIEHCRLAGIATLAIDLRGHGESVTGPDGEDLAAAVTARDPELFRAMWQDAQAAVDFLTDRGHRAEHIGLLGASVGCSVAIDCARRNPELRTVAVLTPGRDYLGIDTMAQLNSWGDRDLLLVSSEQERGNGAGPIRSALLEQDKARVESWWLPDRGVHGTRMFGKVRGIEQRLVFWFLGKLWPDSHLPWFVPMKRD